MLPKDVDRWYYPLRWLIIVALGLAVYAQTFSYGFVFDDEQYIVKNLYLRSFTQLKELLHVLSQTRTVGMSSFAFNYALNGLDPRGYHIFNFLVHLLATGAVWAVAGVMFKAVKKVPQGLPFLIALLFLVHPVQTQAVTYISQRFESMAALFYLGAVYCYCRARLSPAQRARIMFLILCALCAYLGFRTKEVAGTIPLMILVVEWILFPLADKKNGWVMAALVLGMMLFLSIVGFTLPTLLATVVSQSHDGDIFTPGTYVLTQLRVFLTFMRLLVFPASQNLDYDYPMSTSLISPPLTLVGACVVGIMVFLIIKWRRAYPLVALGLAWVLITFTMNIPVRANAIFEHKLYLISFGFFLAVVAGLSAIIPRRKIVMGLLAVAIAVLAVVSFQRNRVWESPWTLWSDAILKSPRKLRVHDNLVRLEGTPGQMQGLLKGLNTVIDRDPQNHYAHMTRGVIYHRLGYYDLALADLDRSVALDPAFYMARYKRSLVHRKQKNTAVAMADLAETIRLKPDFKYAYMDRAMLWMAQGKPDAALADLNAALKIDQNSVEALIDQGGVYFATGLYPQALESLDHAQRLDPANTGIRRNKEQCLLRMGRTPQEAQQESGGHKPLPRI